MDEQVHSMPRLERQRAFIIRFLYWTILIACAGAFGKFVLPVLLPFLLAFLIAGALNRPACLLSRRLKIKRKYAAVVLTGLFFLLTVGLMFWLSTEALDGVVAAVGVLPEVFDSYVIPVLQQTALELEKLFVHGDPELISALEGNTQALLDALNAGILSLSNYVLTSAAGLITMVPGIFMKTVITVIVTFFVAADLETITAFLRRQLPEQHMELAREARQFLCRTLPRFIFNYALILTMTFAELFLGLSLLGVPHAFLAALIIALLDILPILGTGSVLIPWAVLSLIQGNIFMAVGIAALYVAITVIRNIVEPRLIGKQMGLHPVLTLAGMLLGLHFLGILGLFGVPVLLSFLKNTVWKDRIK